MTYSLLIGQKSYSSWSLRAWLIIAPFDIPCEVESAIIYSDTFASQLRAFGGNSTVPVLRTPHGGLLTDSLAIAWHLAEVFPDKRLLPEQAEQRAEAQSIIAEMHSGFHALRSDCPMNLRTGWSGFAASKEVLADVERAESIWQRALNRSKGPFLFGDFTLADAFYAPVATRLLTYDLPMSDAARDYAAKIVAMPEFVAWRNEGLTEDDELACYDKSPLARRPFPMNF